MGGGGLLGGCSRAGAAGAEVGGLLTEADLSALERSCSDQLNPSPNGV